MSDQADNLRQLVRARREWRESALEELPPPVNEPRSARSLFLIRRECEDPRRRAGAKRDGLLVTLVARWALGRISR
jgi:hypothetical protein